MLPRQLINREQERMNSKLALLLWNQLGAAIDMLANAMEMCPDQLWSHPENWNAGATELKTLDTYKPEFWYNAYHVLFWTDYFLSNTAEEDFQPPAPFGKEEFDDRGLIPPRVYTKTELLDYLNHCRNRCRAFINSLSDQSLFENSQTTFRQDYPVLEVLLYNLRHVQHHTAQLNLLLRQEIDSAPRWVGRTKLPLVE